MPDRFGVLDLMQMDVAALGAAHLEPVRVAVLDTGVDATHPSLDGRVSEAFSIVREERGPRAVSVPVPENRDPLGHGTAVAGVIARVAPNARIIDVQVGGDNEQELTEGLLVGMRLALLRRFPVINASIACHGSLLEPLIELCEAAYWQNQLLVAARRNAPVFDHGLPARLSSCIGVDCADLPTPHALRFQPGHPIEFAAAGNEVEVLRPGGGLGREGGTSFAAPVVSGVCALLLGANPGLTPFEVRTILKAWGS